LRAAAKKRGQRSVPAVLSARLLDYVKLDVRATGEIAISFDDFAFAIGRFSTDAAERVKELPIGVPVASFAAGKKSVDKELNQVVRRLATRGLVEYPLTRGRNGEQIVVIEPQTADYWPQMPPLRETDALVLSRFAYMRRRASDMVLESPRARALFNICDRTLASGLASLSTPQQVKKLRRETGFPPELLALLVDCQILFKPGARDDAGLRPTEGDQHLVLWDFHDLLFHSRSTEGRHGNPAGGVYAFADSITPRPAVRPTWPGKKIDLHPFSAAQSETPPLAAKLLHDRHSTREFDEQRPITLPELAQFLDQAARVHSTFDTAQDHSDGDGPSSTYAIRPYPSGGASYELELYLAVDKCEGLPRGFYHYDAGEHVLVLIDVPAQEFEALLKGAEFAMGAPGLPQILVVMAARFGRVSWKYSSIAYSLILKDVGVLMQTLYLMATGMGLGGCAIGSINIDLFARMTGLEFHVEGPVGQFALGRGKPEAAG
jgi:SagB-type dehydrogenase family enzyme